MGKPEEITATLLAERAKAKEYAPLVRPYMQGYADSTHRGVRNGPVHLFTHGNEWSAIPLCGRRVQLWNFEGETETDFCPRCIRAALTRLQFTATDGPRL